MNDYPRWKHLLVALVTALGILYAVPSLFQKQPAVQVIANKGALVDEALKERALQAIQERKMSFDGVEIKDERLQVGFPNTDSQLAAASALRTDLGDKYTVALNLASTVPAWMRMIGANSMPLGLDLQGGVHFLMQVDQKSVLDAQEQRYVDDIRSLIRDREIRNAKVSRAAQGLIVQAANEADRDAIAAAIARDLLDLNVIDGPSIGDQPTLNVTV
ncbi:MAG: protein translocase subunit SecD, partial [Dokdonella sp.]